MSAGWAAVLGFALGAALNAPALWRHATTTRLERMLVHGVDAAHFLAAGLVAGACATLFARWPAARRSPLRQRALGVLLLFAIAAAFGKLVLAEDVENFSLRMAGGLSPEAIANLTTLAIAAAIPGAFVAGRLLARFRAGRVLAVAGAASAFVANGRVLPGDYPGIHFYIAWAAAMLAAAGLHGATFGRSARWGGLAPPARGVAARVAPWLGALLVGATLLVDPPSRVSVALARTDGSALVPFVSRLRDLLLGQDALAPAESGVWFRDRRDAPPIAPARPALLPRRDSVVVLITIDCLRHDLVNSGKYDRDLPNLARLREEAVSFVQARSTGTFTKIALSSVFMGTHFTQQYWRKYEGRNIFAPDADPSPRFPELLQRAGTRTVTLLSIPWLTNAIGIVRGFDVDERVPESGRYTPSPKMFARLREVADSIGPEPAFLFAHISDPHDPYNLGGVQGSAFERYLAEVRLVDRELGRFLEALDRPGLAERTALIVSADHGEAFGEHGTYTHGNTLYDEILRVPLLIRLPGVAPRRVSDFVSLIDLGPTILDLMGRDTPGHFMGQSLVGHLRGQRPELTRPIVAETRRIRALLTPQGLKVIVDGPRRRTELYDVLEDPEERRNLADDAAKLGAPLAELERFFAVHRLRRPGYEPPNVR